MKPNERFLKELVVKKVDEFAKLIKGRIRPEGSISPDGKQVKRGGKWVPRKSRKQYKAGDTRTKNGKRYRLQEDGKWRRTKKRKTARTTPSKVSKPLDTLKQHGLHLSPEAKEAYKTNAIKDIEQDIKSGGGGVWKHGIDEMIDHISHPDYVPWENLLGMGSSFIVAANLGDKVFGEGESLNYEDIAAIKEVESFMRPARTDMKVYRGGVWRRIYGGTSP